MRLCFTVNRRPVSVNASYAKTATAFYMTKEAKDFKAAVASAAFAAANKGTRWPVTLHDCHVRIEAYNTRHDVDGVGVKIILDAMQKIVYENDRQVKELTIAVLKDATKEPRVEIEVLAL